MTTYNSLDSVLNDQPLGLCFNFHFIFLFLFFDLSLRIAVASLRSCFGFEQLFCVEALLVCRIAHHIVKVGNQGVLLLDKGLEYLYFTALNHIGTLSALVTFVFALLLKLVVRADLA